MTSTKSQVMNEFESSLFLFFCIALQAVVLQPPPVQQVFAQLHGQVLYDIQPASLTSHDFQSIEWKRKNTTILNCWSSSRNCMNLGDSKDKVIFNFDNNKLIIKDVSESDEGDYVLNIITYNGVVKQTHVRLLVLVPVSGPQITIYKKYILPYAVNMSCRVQQGTDPIYAWFKDGQLISESTYRLFSNNSDTLLITNITEQDCGIYICSINNQLSRTEAKQQVAAEDFPVCPSSARMSTGETVACVAGVFCLISLIVLVLMARRYKNHYQGRNPGMHTRIYANSPRTGRRQQQRKGQTRKMEHTVIYKQQRVEQKGESKLSSAIPGRGNPKRGKSPIGP
ncbi:hepatocyte cell adhesion molecule-like isoform X4 [Protopterus annectens]|uniref:hepatocyte cell adhesion molecule-like isoform X4 n=1 Tax=Protopterus annectens TaxID=7888 RepID=UPI001CFBAE35|nr:hepatocyte cell adhesion molecule-like isoform X4 [Protopterus annectens]